MKCNAGMPSGASSFARLAERMFNAALATISEGFPPLPSPLIEPLFLVMFVTRAHLLNLNCGKNALAVSNGPCQELALPTFTS